MSSTKFYKFNVKGTEFKCFYTLLFDYGVVSIKFGAYWCDRTIRFDDEMENHSLLGMVRQFS